MIKYGDWLKNRLLAEGEPAHRLGEPRMRVLPSDAGFSRVGMGYRVPGESGPNTDELIGRQGSDDGNYGSYQSMHYTRYPEKWRSREELKADFQEYKRAINVVHSFIEKMAAHQRSDRLVKIFDAFIHDLKAADMTGA